MNRRMKKMGTVAVFAAALLLIGMVPGLAEVKGNPFKQISDKLDLIQEVVTATDAEVANIEEKLDLIQEVVTATDAEVANIEEKLDNSARLAIVKMTFSTEPNTDTRQNLDQAGGLSYFKIKRYTLTVNPSSLVNASPGIDQFYVVAGVLNDANVSSQVEVFSADISTMSPSPRPGTAVPSFAGTNAFVQVVRGTDGLGTVDVIVNAFVELEP